MAGLRPRAASSHQIGKLAVDRHGSHAGDDITVAGAAEVVLGRVGAIWRADTGLGGGVPRL